MADKTIKIPNGETGQEFQFDVRHLSITVSAQCEESLVSNPGKKSQKALLLNAYANRSVAVNIPLNNPEELKKALADQPLLALALAALEADLQEKFK